ncbi:hypothetical protein CLOSBL3_11302 [Clostridiaceae bacterium BL-3]|nr:hypothetical protein CLOSBL3_11302 [Clostridiaceae bacterium BL-3]
MLLQNRTVFEKVTEVFNVFAQKLNGDRIFKDKCSKNQCLGFGMYIAYIINTARYVTRGFI